MANSDAEQRTRTDGGLKAQMKRLAGYHGYEDLKHELLRVVKKYAASDEHAERIVTHILDTRRPNENGFVSCPTPAEMIDYASQVPASPSQQRAPDENCTKCHGSGWHISERGGISGAERCTCTVR
jgi:hypothetical protein